VAWAVISIALYPIGVPVLYFCLLHAHKDDIIGREVALPSDEEEEARALRIRPLRLLYDFYHPKFWYWEVIETILRLSVTGKQAVLLSPHLCLCLTASLCLYLSLC
jgi:hypothetical protein